MLRITPGSLNADDVGAAQALTDVATVSIVQHQSSISAGVPNAQLSEVLNSRIIIEQAKGRVTEGCGLDMARSFVRIRNHAQNHNLRLTELARGIAEGTTSIVGLDPLRRPKSVRSISPCPTARGEQDDLSRFSTCLEVSECDTFPVFGDALP